MNPSTVVLMSLFFPGLGQLMIGRVGKAMYFAFLAIFMWVISFGILGWIINICAALDAWYLCTQDNPQLLQKEQQWN